MSPSAGTISGLRPGGFAIKGANFTPARPSARWMSRPTPPVRIDGRLQAPLSESAAFVLMQTGRLALEWTAEALEMFELSIAEFATLALIQRLGQMGQSAIAERLGLTKAAMSEVAAGLVGAGLLQRMMPFYDGRQRLLDTTRAGAELVSEAADEIAIVDAQFTDRAGEEVIHALAELPPPNLTPLERALLRLS
jgi:DNA-binding MarR family transcriptional regulator